MFHLRHCGGGTGFVVLLTFLGEQNPEGVDGDDDSKWEKLEDHQHGHDNGQGAYPVAILQEAGIIDAEGAPNPQGSPSGYAPGPGS